MLKLFSTNSWLNRPMTRYNTGSFCIVYESMYCNIPKLKVQLNKWKIISKHEYFICETSFLEKWCQIQRNFGNKTKMSINQWYNNLTFKNNINHIIKIIYERKFLFFLFFYTSTRVKKYIFTLSVIICNLLLKCAKKSSCQSMRFCMHPRWSGLSNGALLQRA